MSTKVNHRSWLLIGSLFAISSVISGREYVPRPEVPKILRVPARQMVLLKALGKGVQIYGCKAKPGDPGKFEWGFKAPEADLTNGHGEKIAKHYAGPTWEANDGSKVVGEKNAEAPRPGAVSWLLLKAKSNEGTGTFAKVTYIQRVDTEGGVQVCQFRAP